MLKKLYSYGIRGNVFDWFESYLSERSQYVEFQTTQSDTKPITHGVPQGSILGPILFIIDINDFSRASDKLFSILYADDTSVFIEGYEYDKLIEIMNNEMKKVDNWLQANGFPPNMTSKTLLRHLKTTYRYCRQRQVVIKMLTIWK